MVLHGWSHVPASGCSSAVGRSAGIDAVAPGPSAATHRRSSNRCSTITHPQHTGQGCTEAGNAATARESVPKMPPLPLCSAAGAPGQVSSANPGAQKPHASLTDREDSWGLHRTWLAAAGYSPSTQEGAARVVPATCPGKQEHFTVWERSSILFLLQHL